ncbi:MAG: HAMP domain-containing histidine kinase [Gammaproteobacteria bacterium]|nr:HAMP domain-containing histidine kinase [Gammaproteobacteria bacterium]
MAQDAQALSQLKSGFVSSVSHELRTPLTSILGSIGLLRAGVDEYGSPRSKEMLEIAYNNADRLMLLISDILDIEKIESGKMELKFSSVNINELIVSCITHNSGLAEKYRVKFNFKPDSSLPLLKIDKDRIIQVMNNLMSNAAKFEPDNGTIELKAVQENNYVRVSVTDHGTGIPLDFQDKIFHKFTQADVSNTKNIPGTGLGLAISKKFIEHHHGKIGFTTKQNEGSCFYFILPTDTH